MQVPGIRFCSVSPEAEALAAFLGDQLGLPARDLGAVAGSFPGAVFPAGDSWIEVWPEGESMPACIMLQIVVDDADAMAAHARANRSEHR
jgi:hypothetical protein